MEVRLNLGQFCAKQCLFHVVTVSVIRVRAQETDLNLFDGIAKFKQTHLELSEGVRPTLGPNDREPDTVDKGVNEFVPRGPVGLQCANGLLNRARRSNRDAVLVVQCRVMPDGVEQISSIGGPKHGRIANGHLTYSLSAKRASMPD